MKRFGYSQIVTTSALRDAAFDLRHTVQLHCEEHLENAIAVSGMTPIGPAVGEETPMVWDSSPVGLSWVGFRPTREDEEPTALEFRYVQYARSA